MAFRNETQDMDGLALIISDASLNALLTASEQCSGISIGAGFGNHSKSSLILASTGGDNSLPADDGRLATMPLPQLLQVAKAQWQSVLRWSFS